MSTTVKYNGSIVATVEGGNTATLPVKDLNMKTDIVITVPEGEGGTDSPLPIAVSTEAEMTALLTSGEIGGVYKYVGTSGTYENGALYVLEEETASLISFTIDGTTYQAEDGMTWEQWLNSEYNTNNYFTSGGWVRKNNSNVVGLSVGNPVYIWNNISANTAYAIITTSGLGPEPA